MFNILCNFDLWQACPLLHVVHPVFPLPTTTSLILQGALKDGFGEAVVARDMLEPCKSPSLDSCQMRFLWTQKEGDAAPHPIILSQMISQVNVGSIVPDLR